MSEKNAKAVVHGRYLQQGQEYRLGKSHRLKRAKAYRH